MDYEEFKRNMLYQSKNGADLSLFSQKPSGTRTAKC